MKNSKIVELYNRLASVKGLKGVQFNYAIARNMAKLESEFKSLSKSQEPTPEYAKFEDARVELLKKYAKKDEKGEFVIVDNSYELEDKVTFEKEYKVLKEEHKEVLDARTEQMKEYAELLDKENTIELHKIKFSDVPEDISTEQMVAVADILID